jgi:hypothetical protein
MFPKAAKRKHQRYPKGSAFYIVITIFLIIPDILKSSFAGGFIKRMDEKSLT